MILIPIFEIDEMKWGQGVFAWGLSENMLILVGNSSFVIIPLFLAYYLSVNTANGIHLVSVYRMCRIRDKRKQSIIGNKLQRLKQEMGSLHFTEYIILESNSGLLFAFIIRTFIRLLFSCIPGCFPKSIVMT